MNSEPAEEQDIDLMLRVSRGDMKAFESLVIKYQTPIKDYISRQIYDYAEAEDLAQRVFIQAFRAANRYRPTAKFSTWLFTIARNLCLNEIRRRGRKPSQSLEKTPEMTAEDTAHHHALWSHESPTQSLLRKELEELLELSLQKLPEQQRSALLLFDRQGMTYDEIAQILEKSLSATKSLIHRARETLKATVRPYMDDNDQL